MATDYTTQHNIPKPNAGDKNWAAVFRAAMDTVDANLGLTYAGDPNGHVAGAFVGQLCYNSSTDQHFKCTLAGPASGTGQAVWVLFNLVNNNIDWINPGGSFAYINANTLRYSGDVTQAFQVGRRVQVLGTGFGPIYGSITGATYSSPFTSVVMAFDSGTMDTTVTTLYLGHDLTGDPIGSSGIHYDDNSIPQSAVTGLAAALASLQQALYPIGSVYTNATNSANPNTLLGFGTWMPLAQGQMLIGAGTGTDANSVTKTLAGGDTGGEYSHTLSVAELPSFSLSMTFQGGSAQGGTGKSVAAPTTYNSAGANTATNSIGGGGAHNNLPPYLTVYIWKRTA